MSSPSPCPPTDRFRELIDGRLSPPDLATLAAHLAACPACRQHLASVAGLRESQWPTSQMAPLRAVAAGLYSQTQAGVGITAGIALGEVPAECPERIGPYRIVRQLGAGGMGVVYEAEDAALNRRLALKVLRPEAAASSQARERFVREAKLAAALTHPHVVVIHQVGEDGGVIFLAMELLEGESLASRLTRGPLSTEEVGRVGRELSDALAAFHGVGVVHRDVSPANVWLHPGAGVKLLDFGLAKHLGLAGGRPAPRGDPEGRALRLAAEGPRRGDRHARQRALGHGL